MHGLNTIKEETIDKCKCEECNHNHYDTTSFCRLCNACLYKNSVQLIDDQYPLFRCTVCHTVNFWD